MVWRACVCVEGMLTTTTHRITPRRRLGPPRYLCGVTERRHDSPCPLTRCLTLGSRGIPSGGG
ncbi:hypothetical protein E2C01_049149 [Portunus trituberculatus]|uniref:Uncharacterized protein n=1 Tax=Portunus trituberculatus TaxID=210409 RepID=A0A5B7GD30_PORTR|nr:hypothetical protein [Portunus trituberculatus]